MAVFDAPRRFFDWVWNKIWSPWLAVFLFWLWWRNGFVWPDFMYWSPWSQTLETWKPHVLAWTPYALVGCSLLLVIRWWFRRPPVRIEEKIVYKEQPQRIIDKTPPPSEADLARMEYERTVEDLESLPLDETERRVALKRAKAKMLGRLGLDVPKRGGR